MKWASLACGILINSRMQANRKTIVIYPGRFQPMLPHHVEVLRQLGATYGDEVYVGTTGKVDPAKGNYFTFEEKQTIANTMYGISKDHVLEAKISPYLDREYRPHFNDNDVLIFAVGEKDAAERMPNKNMNSDDVNLKKDGSPSYMQPLQGNEDRLESMSKHAYVAVAPNVEVDGEVASASAFRKAFAGAEDDQHAKEVFEKFFGSYNESVFQLVNQKLRGPKSMNESINELRKLAGILNESAPVDFEGDQEDNNGFDPVTGMTKARDYDFDEIAKMAENAVFSPSGEKQRAASIANRIDGDINDPKVRGAAIMDALKSGAGASIISEIAARIDPNYGNQALLGSYLSEIVDKLEGGKKLGNLPEENQLIVAKIAASAAQNMDLQRSDSEEVDESDNSIPQVHLEENMMVDRDRAMSMHGYEGLAYILGASIGAQGSSDILEEYIAEKGLKNMGGEFGEFVQALIEFAEIRPMSHSEKARANSEAGEDIYELEEDEKEDEKPDYADIDGDGNEEESMEKAAKDKKKKEELDEAAATADRAYEKGYEAGKEAKHATCPEKFADGAELEAAWNDGFEDAQKDKENINEYDEFNGADEQAPQPGDTVDHEQKGRLEVVSVVHSDVYGQPAVYLVRDQDGNEFQMSYDFLTGAVDNEIEGAPDGNESQELTNEEADMLRRLAGL